MGSSQSTPNRTESECKRRVEAERQEQQRRAQEDELKRKQQEEQRQEQKRKEELERKRKLEEEEQIRRDNKERENKLLEYKHTEELQRIKDLEQNNLRKDNLTEKQYQLEHERLVQGQEQMFSILKDTFGKVKDVDITQAVYSAYIMQCIHTGKPIDKDVLGAVTSKVPNPPLPNLEQIVENVIHKCEEEEYGHSFAENRASGDIVSSHYNRS